MKSDSGNTSPVTLRETLQIYILIQEEQRISVFNGFIRFLKLFPGLKTRLHYRWPKTKQLLITLQKPLSLIFTLIKGFMSYYVAVGIGLLYLYFTGYGTEFDMLTGGGIYLLYFLMIILGPPLSSDANIFMKYVGIYRFDPRATALSLIRIKPLLSLLGRSCAFVTAFILNGLPVYQALAWSFNFYALYLFYTYFILRHYDRTGKTSIRFLAPIMLVSVFGGIFLLSRLQPSVTIAGLPIALLYAGPTYLTHRYLKRYPRYLPFVKTILQRNMVALEKISKSGEVELTRGRSTVQAKGEGYVYLNRLFFVRHRKQYLRPMLIRFGVVVALVIILVVVLPANKMMDAANALPYFMPIFFYFTCNDQNITRLMYIHCDSTLIYYGFYREGSGLLELFILRFLKLFSYNLLPTVAAGAGSIYLLIQTGRTPLQIAAFLGTMLLYAVFFSMLTLFNYYVFQPYSTENDAGVNSGRMAAMSVWNMFIYFLFLTSRKLPVTPTAILGIQAGVLLLFILAFLVLIYKFAPKTMKAHV